MDEFPERPNAQTVYAYLTSSMDVKKAMSFVASNLASRTHTIQACRVGKRLPNHPRPSIDESGTHSGAYQRANDAFQFCDEHAWRHEGTLYVGVQVGVISQPEDLQHAGICVVHAIGKGYERVGKGLFSITKEAHYNALQHQALCRTTPNVVFEATGRHTNLSHLIKMIGQTLARGTAESIEITLE
ncbi:MAG: hypothetical protein ACTSWQ_08400 [Candidatus Thorarchaeota archaeon]